MAHCVFARRTRPAHLTSTAPERRLAGVVLCVVILGLLVSSAGAQAQQSVEPWELRICADPDNAPISARGGSGFENIVAEIVADELGAYVTYEWIPIDAFAVRTKLRTGECDVLLSVAESAAGMLNTVAWYRVPFAFVYRSDATRVPGSMLDPVLAELDIGVSPNSLLNKVLYDLGLQESFTGVAVDRAERGMARYQPLVDAVTEGLVDVVIFESPFAAAHVAASDGELSLSTVTPEIVPPFSPMFRVATMGVRAEDQALRDALNEAIAARFDEIQGVFEEMGVPTLDVSQPLPPLPIDDPPLRVGLLAPIPTGSNEITDAAAEAAWYGSRVGDELVNRTEGRRETPIEVLFANTPSPAAAARAVARLVVTSDVAAVVGGVGPGQAGAISDAAEKRGVLFFNVGDGSDALRTGSCRPLTFHVTPSDAIYADALALRYGDRDVFVVHHIGDAGSARAARVVSAWGEGDGRVVGSTAVPIGPMAYADVVDAIQASGAGAVVVALEPADLEFFMAQLALEDLGVQVLAFPDALNQTRDFFFRLREAAPGLTGTPRVVAWDPSLEEDGAGDVSLRFHARSGEPMDPTGWGAYAAVEIVSDAYATTGSRVPTDLATYLEANSVTFDVLKGPGTGFRDATHQLRQPLYLVQIDPDAPWDQRVSMRVDLAYVVGRIPSEVPSGRADAIALYDRLGTSYEPTECVP